MDDAATELKRLGYRAWHRGTKEADLVMGNFFDRHHAGWNAAEVAWFEALMDEDDAAIMGWVMGSVAAPAHVEGPLLVAMRALDYLPPAARA
jgi:antitoxin CptB